MSCRQLSRRKVLSTSTNYLTTTLRLYHGPWISVSQRQHSLVGHAAENERAVGEDIMSFRACLSSTTMACGTYTANGLCVAINGNQLNLSAACQRSSRGRIRTTIFSPSVPLLAVLLIINSLSAAKARNNGATIERKCLVPCQVSLLPRESLNGTSLLEGHHIYQHARRLIIEGPRFSKRIPRVQGHWYEKATNDMPLARSDISKRM
jgi:hypothetical protein